MSDKIAKNKEFILITIGTLLLILSFCLLFYDRVELIKSNVFDEVELLRYRENSVNEEPENVSDEPKEELEVSEIEVQELEEDVEEETTEEVEKDEIKNIKKNEEKTEENIIIPEDNDFPIDDENEILLKESEREL